MIACINSHYTTAKGCSGAGSITKHGLGIVSFPVAKTSWEASARHIISASPAQCLQSPWDMPFNFPMFLPNIVIGNALWFVAQQNDTRWRWRGWKPTVHGREPVVEVAAPARPGYDPRLDASLSPATTPTAVCDLYQSLSWGADAVSLSPDNP